MKAKLFLIPVAALAAGLLVTSANAQGRNGVGRTPCDGCIFDGTEMTPLSDQEQQDVLFMREEEKLARDVYRAMFDLWEVPTFSKISDSEQRHLDAMGRLIVRYDLVDPVVDDTAGVFTNPVFVQRYDELVAAGSVSMIEALKVGALIEELDISDLRVALAQTDHADLEHVFGNLMRGSRNHLRAFASLLAAESETYEAIYLTQDEFDEIASSPFERGSRRRGGQCSGKNGAGGDPMVPDRSKNRRGPRGR